MRLHLVVRVGDAANHGRALTVDVEPTYRVGDLVTALINELGIAAPPGWQLYGQDGTTVRSDIAVADSGLLSGDEVVISGTGSVASPTAQEQFVAVDVVGGSGRLLPHGAPGPGVRSVQLPAGRHMLGRDPDAELQVLNDLEVSRRHLSVDIDSAGVVVTDLGSSNGTFVDGSRVSTTRQLAADEFVTVGGTILAFRAHGEQAQLVRDRLGHVPFNRVPYFRVVPTDRALPDLPAPPSRLAPPRSLLGAALAPLLVAVVMAAALQQWQYLLFGFASPILAGWVYLEDRRRNRKTHEAAMRTFWDRVHDQAGAVNVALAVERTERYRAFPDAALLSRSAPQRPPRLWQRDPDLDDFLVLRLGTGQLPSKVSAGIDRGGDDEVRQQAVEALEHQHMLLDGPVCADVRTAGTLAVVGRDGVEELVGALIAQAAALHSPEDLVVLAAAPPGVLPWLKWLPHSRSATSPVAGQQVVDVDSEGADLLARLFDAISQRRLEAQARSGPLRHRPHVLVVLYEDAQLEQAAVAQLLDSAPEVGISALWVGEQETMVPRRAGAVVSLADAETGVLRVVDDAAQPMSFAPEGLTAEQVERMARALAPVRDAGGTARTAAIPTQVSLLALVEMTEQSPATIRARWAASARSTRLAAPVGIGADGPVVLDLVEHGPHALIAGTSGSGKSEFLQSWVSSLAATHPPSRLNFLFIDYKGGAAVGDLTGLPHSVGSVTDLDAHLSARALISLRAELHRREELIAQENCKDLEDLRRKDPEKAPPSLALVIDEFATLVREVPDFVAGVVDIAQRGRSLGIHLVLATQRPAGSVNDNILANTNLRVSLRVLDPEDSRSVIDSADAAEIPVPLRGRGFARTGHRSLTAFQAAYGGAPASWAAQQRDAVTIRPFTNRETNPTHTPGTGDRAPVPEEPTELQRLVRVIDQATEPRDREQTRAPWLPPLPALVDLHALDAAAADPGRIITLGLLDEPAAQRQPDLRVDLEGSGGLLVVGAGGSGKTTILTSLAGSIALSAGPEQVWLYAVDFAGRRLGPLRDLPHCGAVIDADELERLTRLVSYLKTETARRSRLLAAAHAANLTEYRGANHGETLPRIVVLIDGWPALTATFDNMRPGMNLKHPLDWVEDLKRLVIDGRPVGVHLVVTSPSEIGLPLALRTAVSAVLRLRSAEDAKYRLAPSGAVDAVTLPPGRGVIDEREVQVAVLGTDPSGGGQATQLHRVAARHRGRTAPPIDALPSDIPLDGVGSGFTPVEPVVGVGDAALAEFTVDLRLGHYLIAGPRRHGRSTALETIARAARRAGPVQVWLLTPPASPLTRLAGVFDRVATDETAAKDMVTDAADLTSLAAGPVTPAEVPTLLLVDDADLLAMPSCDDDLHTVARSLAPGAPRLVCAIELKSLRGVIFAGPWIGELARGGNGFLLGPDTGDASTLGAPTAWQESRPGMPFPPGRGYAVTNRTVQVAQFAHQTPGAATAAPDSPDAPRPGSRAHRKEQP